MKVRAKNGDIFDVNEYKHSDERKDPKALYWICWTSKVTVSMMFLSGPLFGRWRDLTYTYDQPSFVMKTNNVTVITYIENEVVRLNASYNTAEMWNSTNIVVRKTTGRNFFGYKLEGDTVEFVTHRGE